MSALKTFRLRRSPFHRLYPSPDWAMTAQIDRRVAVDRARSFIYFRIPKAANSTVAATLHPSPAREVSSDIAKRSFSRASSLTYREVRELAERFFLFTVVRDPYSRLASAYLDKDKKDKARRQIVAHRSEERRVGKDRREQS